MSSKFIGELLLTNFLASVSSGISSSVALILCVVRPAIRNFPATFGAETEESVDLARAIPNRVYDYAQACGHLVRPPELHTQEVTQ